MLGRRLFRPNKRKLNARDIGRGKLAFGNFNGSCYLLLYKNRGNPTILAVMGVTKKEKLLEIFDRATVDRLLITHSVFERKKPTAPRRLLPNIDLGERQKSNSISFLIPFENSAMQNERHLMF